MTLTYWMIAACLLPSFALASPAQTSATLLAAQSTRRTQVIQELRSSALMIRELGIANAEIRELRDRHDPMGAPSPVFSSKITSLIQELRKKAPQFDRLTLALLEARDAHRIRAFGRAQYFLLDAYSIAIRSAAEVADTSDEVYAQLKAVGNAAREKIAEELGYGIVKVIELLKINGYSRRFKANHDPRGVPSTVFSQRIGRLIGEYDSKKLTAFPQVLEELAWARDAHGGSRFWEARYRLISVKSLLEAYFAYTYAADSEYLLEGLWNGNRDYARDRKFHNWSRYTTERGFALFVQELKGGLKGRGGFITSDSPYYRRAMGIENRIADLSDFKIRSLTVVNTPGVQAFVGPTRDVFITKGLLDLYPDDGDVAFVLGHETAHAVLDHPFRRIWEIRVANAATKNPLAYLFLTAPTQLINAGRALLGKEPWWDTDFGEILNDVLLSRYSQFDESEADRFGMYWAYTATGWNPHRIKELFTKLGKAKIFDPSDILSGRDSTSGPGADDDEETGYASHPSDSQRIKDGERIAREILHEK